MEFFERKLIETVKQYKCLYDTHDAKYKNILYREKVWTIISESLNVDVAFCKKKWRNLRDINRRCIRLNLLPSDSTAAYPRKQWKHTEAMKFLNDIKQERTETSNTPIEEDANKNNFAPSVAMISTPSFEILPSSPSVQLQEYSRFSGTTESSPLSSPSYSSHSQTNKKRKRAKEDDDFAESIKLAPVNVSNFTRPVTEMVSRNREPIQRYFSVLAQEIVNANVPLSIQRSIFKGCQKLTYSVLENYEFS